MTEDRTHEFRWRVAAPGGRWREEKKDNSKGDRMIGWGIKAPASFPISHWRLVSSQPLTANRPHLVSLFPY
jgi:hypothetical protein